MPRRALRCIVDLQLQAVSAPGVWLPSREDVYISISLFNQYRNTRCLASVFPLLIHERFRFEKTYYTAVDPSQVAEMLEDELVIFELVQLSEYTDGAVRLASFSTNARDFLYPYPSLAPSYSSHDREALMCRTIAFPGISPKIEFSTKSVIKESISPEMDALDDAQDMERMSRLRKSRRSTRARSRPGEFECEDQDCDQFEGSPEDDECPPHYCMPTVSSLSRSRSPSPAARRKLADIDLDGTIDPRPPFVVRKLSEELIGRTPSGTTSKGAKSKPKRSASPVRPASRSRLDELNLSMSSYPRYRLSEVIREPLEYPLPVFKPRYELDIDPEIEALTSTKPCSPRVSRPRSVSPLLTRRTFRDRYGDTLDYSPGYYARLAELDLERSRRARRLAEIYDTYDRSLDDLDLELRLARIRAGLY